VNFDSYIRGFLNVALHSQAGHNSFLMGEHSTTGFLLYFPIAFLVKTPIAMLVLLLLTAVFYTKINKDYKKALQRDIILFIPIIVFVGAFVLNKINIGLRHILPAYPFLFIWVSQSINVSWKKTLKVVVFSLLILAYLWASLSIAPNYLAYFNEFAGGPDKGHEFLIDSNIDWGQDLKQLGFYLKENNITTVKMAYFGKDSRAYRGIDWEELKCAPESGILAVSVSRLVGFEKKTSKCLEWLRKFQPVESIGHSIKVYNISEQEILAPLKLHCDTQCKKKCEDKMQVFEKSIFDESCKCTCSAIA